MAATAEPSAAVAAAEVPGRIRAVQYDACGGAAGLKEENQTCLSSSAVTDVAGVVVDVGSKVNGFKVGDEVVAMLNPFVSTLFTCGLAEYAVASVKLAVRRPPGVSAADGAGLPIAAGTALHPVPAVHRRQVRRRRRPHAPERAGHSTRRPAASATTRCSSRSWRGSTSRPPAARATRSSCAAWAPTRCSTTGPPTPEGAAMRSPSGRRYDGVVHCAVGVGWPAFEPLLSAAGKVVDITASFAAVLTAARHRVTRARKRLVPLLMWPNRADMEFLVGQVKDGKLKTVVDTRSPLRVHDVSEGWEKSIGATPPAKSWSRLWKANWSVFATLRIETCTEEHNV
ncbi:hypothetical protein PVAP13_7KG378765 [Panicum virgatum]|uniref:Uncharacterized protein n=1 Tax=Panicum virgatum TaxID=38727 RepID=A0A8T0QCD9_PANVG|nr:hypothetical protein PVAP13_7KG378765 [Panicum virgatum]